MFFLFLPKQANLPTSNPINTPHLPLFTPQTQKCAAENTLKTTMEHNFYGTIVSFHNLTLAQSNRYSVHKKPQSLSTKIP